MRIVLADLTGKRGLVTKDTVAGGYGSRLVPFSRTTNVFCSLKRIFHKLPSIQLGYLAAIMQEQGHQVCWTDEKLIDGDVALVLSSLVDYRSETAWAQAAREKGMKVGFVGLAASKMPELFTADADFVILGEPEAAIQRLAKGESLSGLVNSESISDLDSLPFPRWDSWASQGKLWQGDGPIARPRGGGFPVLASRSCPEFCTYCPHRILAAYRTRTVKNVADELEMLCRDHARPYIVFRDPLFTKDRDRCLALCDEILSRGLHLRFECETRLDNLDDALLLYLHRAGLRVMTFGIESVSEEALRKVARRPIPESHQRAMIAASRRLGITTAAYYVFGLMQDTWDSIAASIEYAISLGSTFAQFKLLTPYPATPLWKQMQPLVYETDWEKFDGYTPTFNHPNLTSDEMRFLLGAAYARFYSRPSWLTNLLRIDKPVLKQWIAALDAKSFAAHSQKELELMFRSVAC